MIIPLHGITWIGGVLKNHGWVILCTFAASLGIRDSNEAKFMAIVFALETSMEQPWLTDTNILLAVDMVEHLKKGIGSEGQIVHVEDICARKAIHAEMLIELSEKTKFALKCIGVSKLYSHRVQIQYECKYTMYNQELLDEVKEE
ncbi:hypothetical protein RIF29_39993 [Crotalaria pallida]|uniref:Uncharacterized protein n=1 Tax=Crotalaria pallida TaxID=3830 RepID=A0AAN9E2A4_CROPI